jgi:hypothetical protein
MRSIKILKPLVPAGRSGRPILAGGGLLLIAVLALAVRGLSSPLAGPCSASRGGHPGAQAQLQYLHVADRSVTFTFGNSSVPGGFDVPEYDVNRSADGSTQVSFRGASSIEPDGSRSYSGPFVVEPGLAAVRRVSLSEEIDRMMQWRIASQDAPCPHVAELRFWRGSYSNAQVIVTFGAASTVSVEPAVRPAAAPTWVNGSGFSPASAVTLTVAGETARETTTDLSGMFQTAIFVPRVAPGVYLVVATDGAGHLAYSELTVSAGTWP